MRTKIVIEFDGEIEQLDGLIGELEAVCSENAHGKSWSEGGHQIDVHIEDESEEFYQWVDDHLSSWSSDDLRDWIIQNGPMGEFTKTFEEDKEE